jgi:hypothetical protein
MINSLGHDLRNDLRLALKCPLWVETGHSALQVEGR